MSACIDVKPDKAQPAPGRHAFRDLAGKQLCVTCPPVLDLREHEYRAQPEEALPKVSNYGPVVGEYIARRVIGEEVNVRLAEAFSLKMSETTATNKLGQPVSSLTGVYSQSQARKGSDVYKKYCSSCHEKATHSGQAFQSTWRGRSTAELFDYLRMTMPNDKPRELSRDQYADIVAYLLEFNGMPTGPRPLRPDARQLEQIRIAIWSNR